MTTTSIFRTWQDRLAQPRIGQALVVQFARAVFPLSEGYAARGKATNLSPDEADRLVEQLAHRVLSGDGGPRAEEANEQRGRDWLWLNRRRLSLPDDIDPRNIIEFRLVGFHIYDTNERWRTMHAEPIWRCLLGDGRRFEYSPGAWQGKMSRDEAIDRFYFRTLSPLEPA